MNPSTTTEPWCPQRRRSPTPCKALNSPVEFMKRIQSGRIIKIWLPKIVKDSGSRFHSKLKEMIFQTGMEKNLFGNHPVSLPEIDSRSPPPAFASDPMMPVSGNRGREYSESMASSVAKDFDGYPVTTGSTKLSSTDIEKGRQSCVANTFS